MTTKFHNLLNSRSKTYWSWDICNIHTNQHISLCGLTACMFTLNPKDLAIKFTSPSRVSWLPSHTRISVMAHWLWCCHSWWQMIKCNNGNAILLQKLRCRQENKTKSILKRRNDVEIENCQMTVRLGRGKTISNGMQNNVSDGVLF